MARTMITEDRHARELEALRQKYEAKLERVRTSHKKMLNQVRAEQRQARRGDRKEVKRLKAHINGLDTLIRNSRINERVSTPYESQYYRLMQGDSVAGFSRTVMEYYSLETEVWQSVPPKHDDVVALSCPPQVIENQPRIMARLRQVQDEPIETLPKVYRCAVPGA